MLGARSYPGFAYVPGEVSPTLSGWCLQSFATMFERGHQGVHVELGLQHGVSALGVEACCNGFSQ